MSPVRANTMRTAVVISDSANGLTRHINDWLAANGAAIVLDIKYSGNGEAKSEGAKEYSALILYYVEDKS